MFDAQFRHDKITIGCVYDFLLNKAEIDRGLRSAYICKEHLDILKKNVKENKESQPVLDDLLTLLDELGKASKRGRDIILFNQAKGM